MRRLLTLALQGGGYSVLAAEKGNEALILAAQHRPDLVLLDLGLPDLDGVTVLQRLREWSDSPVLILTVKDAPAEKIVALDLGADDFVTKPFHTGELLACIRAALRHAKAGPAEAVCQCGDLVVDLAARHVSRRGQEIKLTETEYALLRLFIRHANKVLTHHHILHEVWSPGREDRTRYLRVYMAHFREKLEPDPSRPAFFPTESDVGYRFVIPGSD